MTAFFRGFNGADGYAGALCLNTVYAHDYAAAPQTFAAVAAQPQLIDSGVVSAAIPAFALMANNETVIVCVVGTENSTQGILDIVGSVQSEFPPLPGFVGFYWASAALVLWERLLPQLETQLPGKSVVFLGHSLGGTICECLTAFFVQQFPSVPVVCWTYGAPRPGDPTFAAAVAPFTFRWENSRDPIVSVPPTAWNGIGSAWPFSGPPPLPTWEHPGQATTIAADGSLTLGSFPLSTLQAAFALANLDVVPHVILEYARRLRLGLTEADLSPPVSGFVEPQILDLQLNFSTESFDMATQNAAPAVAAQFKVTLFYQYGIAGISESFWTTTPPAIIRSTLVPAYLGFRMAIAVDLFQFLYARISNVATPRVVDFLTNQDPGVTRYGKISTGLFVKSLPSNRGAADTSAVLWRLKLKGGPSARMFLHGFDNSQDNQGTFTANPTWTAGLLALLGFLQNSANSVNFQFLPPVGLASRVPITAIAPANPRGATLTMAVATTLNPAQVITVGGVPSAMQGINGRKIVVSQNDPTKLTVTVGGSSPVGTYAGVGGYLYAVNFSYGTVDYASPERLTSHRVGRPFAEPVGKRHNRLPLRR